MSSNELVEQIMAQVIARVATPEQQAIPTENHPIRETAMAVWLSPTSIPPCWTR